jgi:2,3-bisphosphoglycerate-independent phosphoglycerate mutase
VVAPVILVVPDGASEPLGDAPTALERARTPRLDALARSGEVLRVRTIPQGLEAGTEVGLPSLLGVTLDAVPGRGALEAAAAGIAVGADQGAWRLDVRPPTTLHASARDRLAEAVGTLGGTLHDLGGHRHLLVGPRWWGDAPLGPHQTTDALSTLARGPFAGVANAAKAALRAHAGGRLGAWPWGRLGGTVDWSVVGARFGAVHVITTGGVAAGIGRLAGAEVAIAGDVAAQVAGALDAGAGLVVVHDGGADEAAHTGDGDAKVAAIEALDAALDPLVHLAVARGALLVVCPDHGCDPATGRHDPAPVPAVRWTAAADDAEQRGAATGPWRCTERDAADAPLVEARDLLDVPA